MKTKVKRILCFMLAFAMAFTSAISAFAASGYTTPSSSDTRIAIVYNVEKGVTVTAYQIASATYDTTGNNGLTGYTVSDTIAAYFSANGNLDAAGEVDLVDVKAATINAIATDIYEGELSLTSVTFTYASSGTEITQTTLAASGETAYSYNGETIDGATTLLTSDAYYGRLAAGMWIILVSDSGAVVYNPMVVSHWYADANIASSLVAGTVDSSGDFYEDIYDYTTDSAGVVTWSSGAMTSVYAKSSTITVDKDIVNYAGASSDVSTDSDGSTSYDSELMTYGLLAEEEAVDDDDELYDSQESYYEGSESSHGSVTDTSDTADSTEGADYDIGDTVQFEIKTTIPDYAATYFDNEKHDATFMIVDDLSSGLDPILYSDIHINVGGTEYNPTDSDANILYTVALFDIYEYSNATYYKATYAGSGTINGVTITTGSIYTYSSGTFATKTGISLSDNNYVGQRIVVSFSEYFLKNHGNQTVIMYYATTLNANAAVTGDTSASYEVNTADIVYSNSPTTVTSSSDSDGSGDGTPGDEVYIYTFAITDELVKVFNDNDDADDDDDDNTAADGEQTVEDVKGEDENNQDPDDDQTTYTPGSVSADGNTVTAKNPLAGAEFTIYSAIAGVDGATTTIPYVNGYATANELTKAAEDASIDTTNYSYVYTTTSDSKGYISFYGLSEGTYYITETEAPSGYTINDTVYKVVISAVYNTGSDNNYSEWVGTLASYTITVSTSADDFDKTYVNSYTIDNKTSTYTVQTQDEDGNSVETTITYLTGTIGISASQNPIAVVDTTLIKLPSTGGVGVYVLIAISISIIAVAGAAATRKKKPASR